MDPEQVNQGSSSGLGVPWEIALVTVFVVVVFVILGTVWFQIRRNKRRQQQRLLEAELGARLETRSRSSREKRDSDYELAIPEPIADIPRRSKYNRSMASSLSSENSYETERLSKKPSAPRYYWDQR